MGDRREDLLFLLIRAVILVMMATSLPQARVVRKAGQLVAPPPAPKRAPGQLAQQLNVCLQVAVGLWPLTAVMLLMLGLLYYAGMNASP